MALVPVLAVGLTAVALYLSRGVLDQLVAPEGLVRVVLLPPWQSLAAFVGGGLLGWLWLDRRAVPRASATAVHPSIGPILLPLFGLVLLVLPYLPWLPDRLPALQILAGPSRAIVWLVVAAQLVWVLWQQRLVSADWLQRATLRQLAIGIAIATALLTGASSLRFIGGGLYPNGDEPHYLVMAQSLWRDGDLRVENNHDRGDYLEYFPRELEPHYLTRGSDGEIYSIHPVGMPVLMAPVYAAGGYRGVVFAFVLIGALAAGVMWHCVTQLANSPGAATFGWAAVVATAPFLFNAFAVYPEIPAALAVAIAFHLIATATSMHPAQWAGVGVAAAALPWLSTKYAPMSAAIIAVALARLVFPGARGARGASGASGASAAPLAPLAPLAPVLAAVAVVVPYGVSLLAWFYFFFAFWGSPMPQTVYGQLSQTELTNLIFGAPGLFFDQEYGLLPYAPVYVLAATGLWVMWRDAPASRRAAVELAVVFGALLGTVGAFRIWWGGSASPGRPLASGLLLLSLPIAFAFRAAIAASSRRAAQHLLLWVSVGMSGMMLFARDGFLTANGRDGTSTLLEYLSPRWPLWTIAPSFIHHEAPTALVHSALWLLLAAASALAIARLRTPRAGAAALWALGITATAVLIAAIVLPRLPFDPPWRGLDVRARAHVLLLDEFDTSLRPVGVAYTPFQLVPPASLVREAALEVEPGLRSEPQALRVLHNGRFSLPAGTYRIEVEWGGDRSGDTIGLQIGRTGDPFQSFPVDARSGARWSHEFSLPLDAIFVGLRGTPEIERVVKHARFDPLSIVERTQRPREPEIIAASRSGEASIFYFDLNAFTELAGFWVQGGRRTRVAIHRPGATHPLTLRVHSGPVGNRLSLSTPGWQESFVLQPQSPQSVEVGGGAKELVMLELSAEATFVPRVVDPASEDPRPLGIWIEVVP